MKKIPCNAVDYYNNFADFLKGISEKYDARPALSWFNRKQEEQKRTFRELAAEVYAVRESLCAMGLAGKNIAIVSENCYEWLLVYLAAAACGAVTACIDAEQSEETIRQMIGMVDVEAVFVSDACCDICSPLLREEGKLRYLVLLESGKREDMTVVGQLLKEGRKRLMASAGVSAYDTPLKPRQTAAIVYTSGTTSLSKPVMLSHQAILYNSSDSSVYVNAGPDVFSALPFYHTYGMTCAVLATLVRGAHLIFNGNLKTVMRDLQLSKAYSMLTVPLMVEAIHRQIWLAAEQSGKADGLRRLLKLQGIMQRVGVKKPNKVLEEIREKSMGTLKVIICGGAHMSREVSEEFMMMGISILQGYGITECSPLVSVNSSHACKIDSVGLVLPHSEVKIEDEEILVRGDTIMNGYYNAPELTREAMSGEWFCTGDMGYLDKDGFLYITGRKKNLVVFKNGKKVSPEKLEEELKTIPLVKDVMVYGAASGVSTDDVKLAASVYPDQERTQGMSSYEILEELQQEVNAINDGLPFYQQIQMVTIREQEFAKTAMQKIKRHQV